MNKRSIITTILTIIILLLLSLLFYHFSNKKVDINIDIDYPVFKNNKDAVIKRYLKDVNTKNITSIKYEIGKSNDYTTVLFKFYNKDNLENVETLIFNKNKKISLQELFDLDKLKTVIETKKNTENKEEIDYSKINILFNDKSTTFYIKENENIKNLEIVNNELTEAAKISLNLDESHHKEHTIQKESKLVAFTFDDGPSKYTLDIANILEEYNASATFFEVGYNIKAHPEITKELSERGFEIANHTTDHSKLTKLTEVKYLSKINDNNALFKELTGKDMPYLRPPYGSYNDKIKAKAGVPIVTWSLDTRDWESRNKDKVIEMVINNIKEGDIILFHDLYESTRDAVKELMPLLKEQGYQAVSVGELFKSKGITLEAGTSYRYAR